MEGVVGTGATAVTTNCNAICPRGLGGALDVRCHSPPTGVNLNDMVRPVGIDYEEQCGGSIDARAGKGMQNGILCTHVWNGIP